MFKIQLCQPEEGNVTITNIDAEFEYKDLKTGHSEVGTLPMTNYSVPLDFDGEKFLWVEYLSDIERNLCVANITNSIEKPYKHLIEKSFGHISHCKLLRNNRIFLVRALNKCEIRNLDDAFGVVEHFIHIGDEVYAVDINYEDDNKKDTAGEENNERLAVNTNNNDDLYIKIQENNKAADTNPNNIINTNKKIDNIISHGNGTANNELNAINKTTHINSVKNTGVKKEENLAIALLDIDGNVNIWEKEKIYTAFNLYNIKDISQDHKDKQFFSMGYSYYIKYNRDFFAISSDHGCYVIKKKDS